MRGKLLAVSGIVAVAALAGCKGTASSTSAVGPSTTSASAAAVAACPSGMSPDSNGVCQPGGVTPPSPTTQDASGQANVPGANLTASQQQAVQSAEGYLTDGQGFSRAGLIQQLTSSYGDGFDQADAEFAVNYLHPDWYAQAVEAAKGYLNDGQGFSKESLLQQLTSSYGDQFTEGQAEYAVNQTMG